MSPRDDHTRCTVAELTPLAEAIDRQLQCVTVARLATTERELIDERTALVLAQQESLRAAALLPDFSEDFLPTRLGNVLRRYERLAGAPFGLDPIVLAPYIAQVADQTERDYLDDTRSGLDLSVRMVLVWSVNTLAGLVLLWRFDIWLLIPIASFLLAFLSYRGSVSAAVQYGISLQVVVALGRKNLYERLGLDFPPDSDAEIDRNEALGLVLRGYKSHLNYRRMDGQ